MALVDRYPVIAIGHQVGLDTVLPFELWPGFLNCMDRIIKPLGTEHGRLTTMPLQHDGRAFRRKPGHLLRHRLQIIHGHPFGIGRDEAMLAMQVTALEDAQIDEMIKGGSIGQASGHAAAPSPSRF